MYYGNRFYKSVKKFDCELIHKKITNIIYIHSNGSDSP